MRVTREIGFFSLLVLVTLFVQNASATLAPMLPTSSYADGAWQGFKGYSKDLGGGRHLFGRVDFAVYDSENLLFPNESAWVGGLDIPGDGQYIYAYQIFNDYLASDEAVESFAIFGIDKKGEPSGVSLVVDEASIGSQEDPESGVPPAYASFESSNSRGVWRFGGKEGFSFIYKDGHSWFLVFSSDKTPVVGDYEIRAPEEGEFPVPPEIPEPATIALLGIGGALMFTKRRKSIQ